MKKTTGLFALAVTAAFVAACAEMPKSAPSEAEATAQAGYGRAFGRVQYIRGGTEVDWSPAFFTTNKLTLFLRPVGGAQLEELDLGYDGTFVWPLRAGEYELVAFWYRRTSGIVEHRRGRLMTRFAVPRAGQAVYVGDLRIDGQRGGYRIVDRYAETLKQVESRLTDGHLEAVKGLMRWSEARTGSYRAIVPICSTVVWELECTSTFRGVEPVMPADTAQGYPLTANLTPLLEWKPASKPGLRYDVAIYESLALMGTDLAHRDRIQGSLVAYAEGLGEPRYTPPPLAPGRKYQWSVRLRDGEDKVSTWSSSSHALFIVVAGTWGSGRSFGFETPIK